MERIQWGTIMYYVKMSDPEYFKKLNLKSALQVSEIEKLVKSGNINHSIVAKVFYEGFSGKFQYSSKYWYRLSEGGIYQKLTADADVLIAKEIIEYLGKTLDEVIASTPEDGKRKKLRNAQGMIESNSFKMSCVAEAKMEFINQTLSKELDINIKLRQQLL